MTSSGAKKITVLIPCFNEEKGIADVIKKFPQEKVKDRGYSLEIVIIDNNSTDNTAEVARSMGATVIHESKKGKGNAMKAGFYYISEDTDYVVMLDGDDTYRPQEILNLIEPLELEVGDVVIGSRLSGYISEGSMTTVSRIGNVLFSFLVRSFYRVKVTDVLTGYFAWKREAIERLRPHLKSHGFTIEMEMVTKMARMGEKIQCVPISYDVRKGETKISAFKDGMIILQTFIKNIFWKPTITTTGLILNNVVVESKKEIDSNYGWENRLSVVIPALNEEKGIALVIKQIPVTELSRMGYEVEILVVDNASTDKTAEIAKAHGAKVISQPLRGYGNAYKAGFENATGYIIATGDADMTYPFDSLPKLITLLKEKDLDFMTTDRLTTLNPAVMTYSHIIGNWLLSLLTRLLFSWPFRDSQSGMWIFKREIWKHLDVKSSGMPFSQELKIDAYVKGFNCAEAIIEYRPRVGEVKLNTVKDGIRNMSHLFMKRLSYLGSTSLYFQKNISNSLQKSD